MIYQQCVTELLMRDILEKEIKKPTTSTHVNDCRLKNECLFANANLSFGCNLAGHDEKRLVFEYVIEGP